MKKRMKSLLPDPILNFYRKIRRQIELNTLYNYDKKRYRKYAYDLNNEFSEINLRSKITFHYHALEKGLSNANFRQGFGERAFNELFFAMDKYLDYSYPPTDNRFQSAIAVIESYVDLHNKQNFPVERVEKKLNTYKNYLIEENKRRGGYLACSKEELPNFSELNFEELGRTRYSVRDYGEERVDAKKINRAIQIATKTPSVCNRQAWKVYHIKNKKILKKTLELQSGLTGNGENLQDLLLVTADIQFMRGPYERNQTFIDGGLFTMSLLYGLHSQEIAACTLNTNFNLKTDLKIRDLLEIPKSENLIAFISVGSYPKDIKVAKSPRDSGEVITTVIE